jgi:hypothetical protein
VAGGAGEQIVAKFGEHTGLGFSQDKLAFGCFEQAVPVPAPSLVSNVERRQLQAGPATRSLRHHRRVPGQPFSEKTPLGQADTGIDERDRQLIAKPLQASLPLYTRTSRSRSSITSARWLRPNAFYTAAGSAPRMAKRFAPSPFSAGFQPAQRCSNDDITMNGIQGSLPVHGGRMVLARPGDSLNARIIWL